MLWLISNDIYYYKNIDSLKEQHSLVNIVVMPSKKNILEGLASQDLNIGFLSNRPPKKKYHSLMVIIELPPKNDILTTQEKMYGVTEEEALEKLFGLRVSKPTITMEEDLIGQYQFQLFYEEIKKNIAANKHTEPIFELGVPGVGKTYSASCLAGSLGYSLIQLNLTMFVEKGQGVNLLNKFFHYLTTKKPKCVVLFDEFENMVDNRAIMGALLSILGTLNDKSQGGYLLSKNQILIATANNITEIVREKPQFFRLGRWSYKFFFNFPIKKDALTTMEYFAKKNNTIVTKEIIEDIYIAYMGMYTDNLVAPRSVYSQVEINFLFEFFKDMDLKKLKENDKKEYKAFVLHIIAKIIPSQYNTKKGITKLLSDADSNKFLNVDDGEKA